MRTRQIPGFRRGHLAFLFALLGYRRGAEIGVRQAAFSSYLCAQIPGLELLCVDPYRHYRGGPRSAMRQYSQDRHDANLLVATERLAPYRATIVRATSLDAVRTVPEGSLDFVFIDGNHTEPYVRDDLWEWGRRVRPGGIISGDDLGAPGVRAALEAYVAAERVPCVWLTDDPRRRNRRGEVFTAWFWRTPCRKESVVSS